MQPWVLVADDDTEIRATLRDILSEAGCVVLEARDGVQALETLRTAAQPLVILLDLRMPKLDGMGVLNAVASDARLAHRHAFILVTANDKTLPLAFVHLLTELAVPVLPKPFDVDTLLDVVDAAYARLPKS